MKRSVLLDTHCHVGAYADPMSVVRDAERTGTSIVAVTEDPDEYRRLKTRLGSRREIEVALGLHPLRAASFTPTDLARFFRFVPQCAWIGEVGLDFSRAGVATKKQQLKVFEVVLTEAQPGRHPLTVHSRGAEKEVIERLRDAKVPGVMHWYSGPIGPIDDALAAGLYFSFNAAMVQSKRFPSLVRAIPADRVLLETDGPYAKSRGRIAYPHELNDVVRDLANAWGTAVEKATSIIGENQARFLSQTDTTRRLLR